MLVPTGPLTNVATALLLDPGLAERIPRVVLMGGSHARANVTPSAEFNIWADPEAARIVLRSGIRDLTIVPLDATHEALVSEDDCDRLAALGTPAGAAAADDHPHAHRRLRVVQPTGQHRSAPVHDAVCVAHLIDPDVIEVREAHVDVELNGELTRGRTVVDFRPIPATPPNARWAFGADREPFPGATARRVRLAPGVGRAARRDGSRAAPSRGSATRSSRTPLRSTHFARAAPVRPAPAAQDRARADAPAGSEPHRRRGCSRTRRRYEAGRD